MRFIARRYDNRELVEVSLADGRIVRVSPILPSAAGGEVYPWVAPGFVDVQVNGYDGQEFSSLELTAEKVAGVVRRHYAFGVTGICPTLTTQSFEMPAHGMRAIAAACERWPTSLGPCWASISKGLTSRRKTVPAVAHPKEHCRRPDWDEFQRLQAAAGGRISILTMSPEFDEAPEFIARVKASGVVVSIGHTGA